MMKNKYLLFSAFFLIFLFLSNGFVSALEIKYPNLTGIGLPDINQSNISIGAFVGYFFGLGVYLAGILSLISFTIGAISLIASTDNAEAASNAKDRMKGAALGLVLTLVSFIIIQTINPKLATLTPPTLQSLSGVFLINNSTNEQQPCPLTVSDTSTLPSGFDTIKYCCDESCSTGANNGPPLLVWKFEKTGLEQGNSDLSKGVALQNVACGETTSVNATGSFKMAFETPGVYYYLDSGCSGYGSVANTGSDDNIAAPFNGKIKGVKIVNFSDEKDSTNDIKYGVIFHQVAGLENGGKCSNPITTEGCSAPTLTDASAADIFQINQTPETSGDGVYFYSEPYGWNTGANAGFWPGLNDDETITSTVSDSSDVWQANSMNFDYTNVDRTDEYQTDCANFQDCSGSIEISGDYLVALYSGSSYCQTFDQNVENLNTQLILASGSGKNLGNIYIIPTANSTATE